jgi:hypothetical protein
VGAIIGAFEIAVARTIGRAVGVEGISVGGGVDSAAQARRERHKIEMSVSDCFILIFLMGRKQTV